MDTRPIGLFDSGVGGLTILRAVAALLPNEHLVYVADGGRFPYGGLGSGELRAAAVAIGGFLHALPVKAVVVACNSASVAALAELRATFPGLPFIGVVPVVKTLVRETRTGAIALLSTPATARSAYLAGLIAEFASDRRVISVGAPGLAELVERGELDSPQVAAILRRYLAPVRDGGADVLGLACTHYPFLRPAIEAILGPSVRLFDSTEPVAQRLATVLTAQDALCDSAASRCDFYSTGDPERFAAAAGRLLGAPVGPVIGLDPR